nr:PQ-loop domain-containing transporter [Polaromonas naphthalenivorans]
MNLIDLIGSLAACLTTASFVPQAWLSFKTRDVSGDPQPNSAPGQAWGTIHACPLSVSNTGNG